MPDIDKKLNNEGFTLIEVLAAIFVFIVGITAVIYLISKEANLVKTSDDRLTAIYLAQEGIELVRNIREENWVNGRGWRTGPSVTGGDFPCNIPPGADVTEECNYINNNTAIDPDGYVIDYKSGFGLATNDPPELCFYPGNKLDNTELGFIYSPGCVGAYQRTAFKRVIYFDFNPAIPEQLTVSSVVRWGNPERAFEVSEVLYDWNKQD